MSSLDPVGDNLPLLVDILYFAENVAIVAQELNLDVGSELLIADVLVSL